MLTYYIDVVDKNTWLHPKVSAYLQTKHAKVLGVITVLGLITILQLTLTLIKEKSSLKQYASEPFVKVNMPQNLLLLQNHAAAIGATGRIDADRIADIAKVDPNDYQQLVKQGLAPQLTSQPTIPVAKSVNRTVLSPKLIQADVTCGDITSNGTYTLTQNLTGTKGCIAIHDTQNVTLDCQNHTVSAPSDSSTNAYAVTITNAQNVTVKNCHIHSTFAGSNTPDIAPGIEVKNLTNGILQNNTLLDGNYIDMGTSTAVQVLNNTFAFYQQGYSSHITLLGNIVHNPSPTYLAAASITMSNGSNNSVTGNTIDGGWDGVDHASWHDDIGSDDVVALGDESSDIINGNIIRNAFDCGIETTGFIQYTQITSNIITNTGYCGIGGWYWSSWLGNTVQNNSVGGAAYMLAFSNVNGLPSGQQTVYFANNSFVGNTFKNQRSHSYVGDTSQTPSSAYISITVGSPLVATNNIFKSNDFGEAIPAPIILPATIPVDQGGNICQFVRDDYAMYRILTCGVAPTPFVKPTLHTQPTSVFVPNVQPALHPTAPVSLVTPNAQPSRH